jgi:hypothetical protein
MPFPLFCAEDALTPALSPLTCLSLRPVIGAFVQITRRCLYLTASSSLRGE